MKTTYLLMTAALLALAVNLHSQGILPKSPIERLKDLKTKNAEIIDKQTATLLKLDEMEKQSEQMRFMSKRS